MKIVAINNQIVNLDLIEILKITSVNDYIKVTILKKEKFKYKEIDINCNFDKVEKFDENFYKKYIALNDDTYIKIDKIMLIDMTRVENTNHAVDLDIHFVSGEKFVIRTTDDIYHLFLRRMRDV